LNAKPLFLATAHDEFEMLDFNADWVHVRISGLSRGWIWRTSLEMPEGFRTFRWPATKAAPVAADLFRGDARGNGYLPGRLGGAAGQKCENHLGAKDPARTRRTAVRG
jgi:hypothetical protein